MPHKIYPTNFPTKNRFRSVSTGYCMSFEC